MAHINPRCAGASDTGAWRYAVAMLSLCIFLQRFGLTIGNQGLNVVGPLGLASALAGLASGKLELHIRRLCIYLFMVAMIAFGAAFSPAPNVVSRNLASLMQFVAITGFAVFSFAKPMDERAFFLLVSKFLLVVAVAGTVQFFAQLIGVQIFQFSGLLPPSILLESGWNMQISSGVGDMLKSNGFFLVEPSVMSQFMAVALIIELLYFRRALYLAAFVTGFLLSFSGTGGLVLFGFVCAAGLRLGKRGFLLALLLLAVFALATGVAVALEPDFVAIMQRRLDEVNTPGTSGHLRFITPFWLLSDVLDLTPAAALLGTGAGTSEHLTLPYDYNVNTPVKIGLEFGFPVLIAYVTLFLAGERTARQSVLVLPGFILLMLTGQYQQFAPIVFFVSLLICVARLKPAAVSVE